MAAKGSERRTRQDSSPWHHLTIKEGARSAESYPAKSGQILETQMTTKGGENPIEQYQSPLRNLIEDAESCGHTSGKSGQISGKLPSKAEEIETMTAESGSESASKRTGTLQRHLVTSAEQEPPSKGYPSKETTTSQINTTNQRNKGGENPIEYQSPL